MSYLISQIFWCLLLAFLLGFLLGWLLRHLKCKGELAALAAVPHGGLHGYPVEEIEGIGEGFGRRLRSRGIVTTDALLALSLHDAGRKTICDVCEIDDHTLSSWNCMADLLRIDGVGGQWAELLWRCGVRSVQDMAGRDADALTAKMPEVNTDEHRVHELPGHERVAHWIAEARKLEPILRD